MLESIKNGITSILDFFFSIGEFVVGFVKDLGTLATTLADTVSSIPDYFSWLPPELLASILAIFGIVVLYKVLGREG